jgi:hypothetical protein
MAITSLVGIQTARKQSFVVNGPGNQSNATNPRGVWYNNQLVPASANRISLDNTNGVQFVNPAPGQNTYLSGANLYNSTTPPYYTLIVDLIWRIGFAIGTTGVQTLTSPLMGNRDINGLTQGEGVYLLASASGTNSAAGSILSLTYTNSNGVSGRSTVTGNESWQAGRTVFLNLVNGDTGVRSADTAQFSVSLNQPVYLFAYRPIAVIPSASSRTNVLSEGDAISLGLPVVYDNSCVQMFYGNGFGNQGQVSFIQG